MFLRIAAFLSALLLASSPSAAAPAPPELDHALKLYRAEGAFYWALTQTTVSGGTTLVERYDPSKPEFSRWTLLQKNGAAPSASDLEDYRDQLSRRTVGTAPNVKDQIDPASCEKVSDDDTHAVYAFRLKPGDKDDRSAAHLRARFTLNKASGTIEQVELASVEPFSPMFAAKITEVRTVITYSVPTADRPVLLLSVDVHVRGRVMWFKSLDADMTVTYSDHTYVGRKPSPAENPARTAPASP